MKIVSNRRSNRETTTQYNISKNGATEVREGMLSVESKVFSYTMYSEKKDFSSKPRKYIHSSLSKM